uniref:Hexose transporter 1 n=1 Tax=Aureoumbra lagunensis TaxID=44058 RepID=A0A7S3NKM8_9STRA|mmetsp:Transcript_23755/g.30907  ORF Transcript_23755/g.30907 Transcript_23755/m.30907 type:complete len:523 (+) Transcript_23755:31-1599(+)
MTRLPLDKHMFGPINLFEALFFDAPRNDVTSQSVKQVIRLAIISFVSFGYATGVLSGAGPLIEQNLGLNAFDEDILVSAAIIFAGIAAPLGGFIADLLGRKLTIILSAIICLIGTILSSIALNLYFLIGARCIVGIGIGLSFNTVPLYAAECVLPYMRGLVVEMSDFCIVGGQLMSGIINGTFASLVGYGLAWRISLGFGCIPCFFMLYLVFKAPESPRFLAENDLDAAKIVLATLRDPNQSIDQELQAIQNQIAIETATVQTGVWRSKRVIRALYVGMGLQILNQLTGINTAMFYGGEILEKAGFSTIQSIWGSAGLTLFQIFGVYIALNTIDTRGRRFTGLRSLALIIPSLILVGFAFVLDQTFLVFIFLAFYLASFGSGLSGISYIINAEIYPLRIRGRAYSIGGMFYWIINVIVSIIFPIVADAYGAQYPFWAFAVVAIIGFSFYWFYLPETTDRSLEEIDSFFECEPYPKPWYKTGFFGLEPPPQSGLDTPLVPTTSKSISLNDAPDDNSAANRSVV